MPFHSNICTATNTVARHSSNSFGLFFTFFLKLLAESYVTLRVLMEKVCKNNRQKKFHQKKIQKKFQKNFSDFFFWLSWFHSQFGVCLQKFGVSRPAGLGGDRLRTEQ
jgi:hypothetical protein